MTRWYPNKQTKIDSVHLLQGFMALKLAYNLICNLEQPIMKALTAFSKGKEVRTEDKQITQSYTT